MKQAEHVKCFNCNRVKPAKLDIGGYCWVNSGDAHVWEPTSIKAEAGKVQSLITFAIVMIDRMDYENNKLRDAQSHLNDAWRCMRPVHY